MFLEEAAREWLRRNGAKKGWSANGRVSTRRPNVGFGLQADFDSPEYYTLQFSAAPPGFPDVSGWVRPMAEITWKVEGNQIRRLINIGTGVAISGTGQGVNVNVFDDSPVGVPADVEYPVTVQLTRGVRPNIEKPPILLVDSVATIAAGFTSGFGVPQNAGVTSLFLALTTEDGNDAPIENDEIVGRFVNGAQIIAQFGYDACNKWIPVAPGSQNINVVNNRPSGNITATFYWGVEG